MTVDMLDRTRDEAGLALASLSLASLTWFTLALLALHALRPDYHPGNHMISDYAVGPHGWIMTTAFLALSAACATLALGLFRRRHHPVQDPASRRAVRVCQPAVRRHAGNLAGHDRVAPAPHLRELSAAPLSMFRRPPRRITGSGRRIRPCSALDSFQTQEARRRAWPLGPSPWPTEPRPPWAMNRSPLPDRPITARRLRPAVRPRHQRVERAEGLGPVDVAVAVGGD